MAEETGVSYDVDADRQFRTAMQRAIKSGLNLSFSMGESARIIKKDATKNFILKGSGKYSPLNPAYLKRKQILAPGSPILTGAKSGKTEFGKKVSGGGASGKLKKSIVEVTSDSIVRVGETSLEVGTSVVNEKGEPYPIFVQEGTEKKGKKVMPARKFLFLSKRMVKQIINTINADIGRQV